MSELLDLDRRVQSLELEQKHLREVIGLRFDSMEKTMQLVSVKVEKLMADITLAMADPQQSAAGRAMLQDMSDLRGRVDGHHRRLNDTQADLDRAKGAIAMLKMLGVSSLGTAAIAVIIALIKLLAVPR